MPQKRGPTKKVIVGRSVDGPEERLPLKEIIEGFVKGPRERLPKVDRALIESSEPSVGLTPPSMEGGTPRLQSRVDRAYSNWAEEIVRRARSRVWNIEK